MERSGLYGHNNSVYKEWKQVCVEENLDGVAATLSILHTVTQMPVLQIS
jgi:hypothetical protein